MSRQDLLESSKALLALDADGALVPHGLGGHGRTCLTWCVEEIERLRASANRAADIIDANLYRQREKVEDASAILRGALRS